MKALPKAQPDPVQTYLVSWVSDDLEAVVYIVDMTSAQADQTLARLEGLEHTDPYVSPMRKPIGFDELKESGLFDDE